MTVSTYASSVTTGPTEVVVVVVVVVVLVLVVVVEVVVVVEGRLLTVGRVVVVRNLTGFDVEEATVAVVVAVVEDATP